MNMIKASDVTDRIISLANLSREEAKVVRAEYNLESAGGTNSRTRRWVKRLTPRDYNLFLRSGQEKIEQQLQRGAGK